MHEVHSHEFREECVHLHQLQMHSVVFENQLGQFPVELVSWSIHCIQFGRSTCDVFELFDEDSHHRDEEHTHTANGVVEEEHVEDRVHRMEGLDGQVEPETHTLVRNHEQ